MLRNDWTFLNLAMGAKVVLFVVLRQRNNNHWPNQEQCTIQDEAVVNG